MDAETVKQRILERRKRIDADPDAKHLALQNEQSFYNGVVSELARVKAGQPFVPHGACGELVTKFVAEAFMAMTDFYHSAIDSKESESIPEQPKE